MGGFAKSAGGFLGFDTGPKAAAGAFGGSGLEGMGNYVGSDPAQAAAQGKMDQMTTGSDTGSQFASNQVQNDPILGSLFGKSGAMNNAIGKEQELQNQGFQLKPEDQTMYGQMSGNIARQFGQQGNKTANSLASRGLSSSGAAGAAFSGLAGNQNEQLAGAQQDIAQQRFQNTMKQIGQQQQFIGQLSGQAGNDINQQYGRQLAGAQNTMANKTALAAGQQKMNDSKNSYGLDKSKFDTENTPTNFLDMGISAMGSKMGAASKGAGQAAGAGGGGGGLTGLVSGLV